MGKNLRENSPRRGGDGGEEKVEVNLDVLRDENNPPLSFKDPHAARVFADMMPARARTFSDQGSGPKGSKGALHISSRDPNSKNGMRVSKPKTSKRSSLFDPLEDDADDDSEQGDK